jgi:TolB-like protein/predicted Ser/Thr protein kinase
MAPSLSAGTKLGRYEIRSLLGAGGMGEVYLAEDTQLGRRVAVKLLSVATATDEQARKRLIREARAAAILDHPNICSVYEVGEADGRSFIAMQYLEGEMLDARIRNKPLELRESLTFAAQIADALAEAHSNGIIHRDVKPGNIIITSRGQAKVMDFGLARLVAGAVESEADTQSLLTTPGTIMGTMPYMSPEQVRGEVLDGRSDIFSFAVMLYEMLSGRQPFTCASAAATISAILNEEPATLLRYAPDLPEGLQRIASKCLEKDRERRYQTMRDVAIDIDNCRREHEIVQASLSQRAQIAGSSEAVRPAAPERHKFLSSRRVQMVGALLVVLVASALAYMLLARRGALTERPVEIRSLAVLPLKSLDAGENYLGLGIADAVIRRMNQTGQLIVRPTSAVRRYLTEDTDALAAARQLNVDAVLEGSVQRAGDLLRVSVNLLRTTDGASLWADKFDMHMTDIFTIQDTVAQQVASRLRLQLDPSQQARLTRRSTSNPVAYEFYVRGVYNMNPRDRNKQQQEGAIDSFKHAIEADPNFALAHAQLAYAYAATAIFIEPTEPAWVERAREEINRAQTLDPQLAETHLTRSLLLFSGYEGYQPEAAIRELLLAQQLNPNVGHIELGALYSHIGLEDLAARELQRALEIDPTSDFARDLSLYQYQMTGRYDEWLAAHQRLYPNLPISAWYYLGKGRLEEAQTAIEELSARKPDDLEVPRQKALLLALGGDFRAAEAMVPTILSKHPLKDLNYHHAAYDIACIYALEGKGVEAVKWLREGANTGFPCYPLFERDAYLNRIKQAPEFIQFMSEMKAQNERYRREFGEGSTR